MRAVPVKAQIIPHQRLDFFFPLPGVKQREVNKAALRRNGQQPAQFVRRKGAGFVDFFAPGIHDIDGAQRIKRHAAEPDEPREKGHQRGLIFAQCFRGHCLL
ncbi:hypothetical protein AW736_21985 [Termitidicoccus mucosus]|uniref:Uncharacterized protein n=1 Tax=Termitidicoccus mucosus TaxID=1184151 RepID=A0A178IC32_9BACT|nr:hypothetical protein AW736_21985 [Opitutaceae bacterium TSB47]